MFLWIYCTSLDIKDGLVFSALQIRTSSNKHISLVNQPVQWTIVNFAVKTAATTPANFINCVYSTRLNQYHSINSLVSDVIIIIFIFSFNKTFPTFLIKSMNKNELYLFKVLEAEMFNYFLGYWRTFKYLPIQHSSPLQSVGKHKTY